MAPITPEGRIAACVLMLLDIGLFTAMTVTVTGFVLAHRNSGGLSHTSYAFHDALVACELPAVEVHISDINAREPWPRVSMTAPATHHQEMGAGAAT